MRSVSTLVVAVLIFGATAWLRAQQPQPKPGPEHEHFKQLEGTWDATIHEPNGTTKGMAEWKVGLGGLWLLEHFKGEVGGASFEGYGATTWDPAKKKYAGVWVDSMSTSPLITEGTYDKGKKLMVATANAPGPDGKMMKMTMRSQMMDNDNVVFTMSMPGPDGKDMDMKITYKRRAK